MTNLQPADGRFTVGVSRDFLDADGRNVWGDIRLGELDAAGIDWHYLPRDTGELLAPDVDGLDAVLFAAPAVTARTFAGLARPPLLFARFGVGYDSVDLDACTRHGALVTITPDGARRPVATAALTLLLAVLHNVTAKDRLVREGRWSEREQWMGLGLTGRRVGLLGLGNTARDLVVLLRPFEAEVLAYDPYCPPETARELGVRLADADTVMAEADAVIVMCVLTEETRHLVDARRLSLMKPSAVLLNVARGPIVDETALIEALRADRIRGAGLDVFETEPPDPGNPLLSMDNVVLAPHSLAWTDEMSAGNGGSAVRAIVDVATGRLPRFVVNRDVLGHAYLAERLGALARHGRAEVGT
ncbi:NAD(P)-dependent oxidoreductase [Streptomyces sp. NL15-2K]|uniref:NAD(P)-dependent oxidoreductase n=1 Tax=Streptomyces sp. NL15-2K TaxID=376149 RepID=UPI000F56260D|nr:MULTISPECIES: NAD(P)-dependent oxidoreductase [Actinomycetes]WKX15732.1 NAD(P)-dependent oxidoreductase [Kutzneria buriramensis]GCB44362.1 D-3-phosphoglycerate dehydrogenase [Streptomyces sp. NL15-2K]